MSQDRRLREINRSVNFLVKMVVEWVEREKGRRVPQVGFGLCVQSPVFFTSTAWWKIFDPCRLQGHSTCSIHVALLMFFILNKVILFAD